MVKTAKKKKASYRVTLNIKNTGQ